MSKSLIKFKNLGCVTFYSEDSQMPCVAVAIGNSLLIYRNMKPYYRCNVEPVDLHSTELSLWTSALEKQIGVGELVEGLSVSELQILRMPNRESPADSSKNDSHC